MEELKQRLIDLANSGIDFATEQLPEVASEYLMFKTLEHGTLLGFGLLLLIVVVGRIKYLMTVENCYDEPEPKFIISVCYLLLGSVFGIGLFFTNIFSFLKVIVAPRVFLLETLLQ